MLFVVRVVVVRVIVMGFRTTRRFRDGFDRGRRRSLPKPAVRH